MKPLIGITAYTRAWPDTGWPYDASYAQNARAIELAGGLPVLIPAQIELETLRQIYERVDGILLPGGEDVDPRHYAQQAHESVKRLNPTRDRAELALARWAVEDDLPALGICRGIQVLNVALGGTLVQDIPSMVASELIHDIEPGEPRSKRMHTVHIDSESRLGKLLDVEDVMVTSLHHQAIETLASQARVSAHAPDGIVEAIELPEARFILAVQWHPEDMLDEAAMRRIFAGFVEATKSTRH